MSCPSPYIVAWVSGSPPHTHTLTMDERNRERKRNRMRVMYLLRQRKSRSIRQFSDTILWHLKIRWLDPLDCHVPIDNGTPIVAWAVSVRFAATMVAVAVTLFSRMVSSPTIWSLASSYRLTKHFSNYCYRVVLATLSLVVSLWTKACWTWLRIFYSILHLYDNLTRHNSRSLVAGLLSSRCVATVATVPFMHNTRTHTL